MYCYRIYLNMERNSTEKAQSQSVHTLKSATNHHHHSFSNLKPPSLLKQVSVPQSKTTINVHQPTFRVDNSSLTLYGKQNRQETITIQNVGRDPIKMSISVPKTIYFCVKQEHRSFTLSAGMHKKIPIQLVKLPPDSSCYDFVILQNQSKNVIYAENKHKVEINWYRDYPTTQYNTLIDLEKISSGKSHQFTTKFKNTSTSASKKISLNKDPMDNIQIQTDNFSLKPGASFKVEFNITPQNQGVYHHKIVVEEDGIVLPGLEIVYAAVNSHYKIEDANNCVVRQVDFGTLLKGIKKEHVLYARNSGPKQVELRVKVKIGKGLRTESSLQSPQELGIQSSSTVIEPSSKIFKIAPFSRTKISLTAYQSVQPKEHQLVERLAKSDTLATAFLRRLEKEDSEHQEVLVCEFIQLTKPTSATISFSKPTTAVVPMRVSFSLPAIKISPSSLTLGQITSGNSTKSTLSIQNLHSTNSYNLQVGKLLNSECFLLNQTIKSKQSCTLDIITKGGNLGAFKGSLQLTIAGLYNVRIPVEYQVTASCQNLLNRQNRLMYTAFEEQSNNQIDFNNTIALVEKDKNKKKYGVPIFRRLQVKAKSSSSLFNPSQTANSIRNSSSFKKDKTYNESVDNSVALEDKTPSRHHKKYPLFVTRKIDKYQPFQEMRENSKLQKTRNYRDYFGQVHRQPKNRKQAEEIQRQLTPQELKLITIADKVVSFGRLFINSKAELEWTIINETQAAIIVQLKDNNYENRKSSMMENTDFEPQIIPSKGAGKFKIALRAIICGKFETTLSYSINKNHMFQLLVSAEIQLVSLIVSKTTLKMNYENDQDLLLSDNFTLKNQGNTSAQFSINQNNQRFIITPSQGMVEAGSQILVKIVENAKQFPVVQAGEVIGKGSKHAHGGSQFEQRIIIKINDGNDVSLKASSLPGLADPRCLVKQNKLNFGCTIVSKQKTKSFQIKNISRNLMLFEIVNDEYTDYLSFDCMKGKIPPEGTKQITVNYKSSIIQNINSQFKVLVKGGLIINVPFTAESIAPEIGILESHFNFGQICCDTAAIRPVNIRNNSQIAVDLFFNNTDDNGVEFLMPSFCGATSQPIRQNFVPKKAIIKTGIFGKGTALEEQIIDNAVTECTVHKIKIEPKSIYSFNFVFKPTQPGFYEFILPIYLENFIRNDTLTKVVSCQVIEPRFIIEPSVVKFKTKIINDKDNGCFHAFVEYLTLRNPTNKVLKWKLDTGSLRKTGASFTSYSSMSLFNKSMNRQTVQQKSCFEIQLKKGELKPKQSVSINISFSPIDEGFYYHKVPLFIFNEQKGNYQQQSQVRLEGQGKYPSLYFNRRYVILPAVPLGIQAIGMFQIENQGYQTINLKHRFQISDSQGNLHISRGNLKDLNGLPELSVYFPYGNKLTLNKKKTICIVKFVSKKATSFSCKLQLFDDSIDCRAYSLPISATADNSLMTTFSYISDPENIYRFENATVQIDKRKKLEEVNTILLKSNDGRHIIDRYHDLYASLTPDYFSLSCRIVKRWINNFFREEKIRQFPCDLALNDDILLKLIHKLTSRKQFDGTYEFQLENGNKQIFNGNSQNKIVFYDTLIRLLKQFGCLLNHIRPEYLLNKDQFIQMMSQDACWKNHSTYYLENYDILNKQAWLVLFYQLYANFWCQRSKLEIGSKGQSNVYSVSQLAVIKWVKSCYEAGNELDNPKDKFMSFGNDYKDCLAPIFCLLRYATPATKQKVMDSLNKWPINESEYAANTKLLYQLLQTLNISPLIYEDEYKNCTDKEIFLFMHQLYELLPQLLPKGSPIVFACQLGSSVTRSIEIKNPSNRTVHYWVKIEGSKDFQPEQKQSISIEPKGVFNFGVQFRGRLSIEQVAYLSFFSKQDGESNSANGTAMVFELKSKITGRSSIKKLDTINCSLYDSTCAKVFVQNIFEDCELANFSIHLIEQNMGYNNSAIKTQMSQDLDSIENKIMTQFYCQNDSIKIKRGLTGFIQLYFTPLRLAKTKCYIIFHDPLVGEFQYQIMGIAQIPRTLQQIRIPQPLIVGRREKIDLNLIMYNSAMLKCQTLFEQRNPEKGVRNREKAEEVFKLELNMDPKILQHITFPKQVILKGTKKQAPEQNKIKIDCLFNSVIKDCMLDFLLLGDPRKQMQDVRRFKVAMVIQHPPISQDLLITTNARKNIVQPFPIDNSSHKDWKIRVNISSNELNYFSLKEGETCQNRDIIVRKGQTQLMNIYFDPIWVCQTTCKVVIHNVTTNEQIILNIKGVSEQPLSEDHIHIRASSDESSLHTLSITNPYAEKITYRVISDLDDLQLPPDVTLEANQTVPFYIFAKSSSTSAQVGFIKFIDYNDRFFWYSVGLQSAQKKVRQFNVEFHGEVGCQIQKQVQFKNPFSKDLMYKVEYPKGFGLQARQQFTVNSHGVHQYRIKFSPQRPIDQQIILKATNEQIGIFLYHIRLKARDQSKRKVIQMSVEVGKTGHHDIRLQNPRNESIKVNYELTNNGSFFIEGSDMLQPGENHTRINFKPIIEGKQLCSIRVWSEYFPTRCFEVEGLGLAPYSIETIHFKTRPGDSALQIIRFVNPRASQSAESVKVCLSQASHGCFKIVGHECPGHWTTQVKDLLAIPIQFKPTNKGYFESVLTIQCFHYQWKYLLKGTTNFQQIEKISEQIKTANKQETIKRFKVSVPEYYSQPIAYFDKITIEHSNKALLKLIRQWLKVRINVPCEDEEQDRSITILAKFKPKKQIKEVFQLVLSSSKEEGPTLSYNIQLFVSQSLPDSTITLDFTAIKSIAFELNGLGPQASISAKMLRGHHCQAQKQNDSVKLKFKPTHLLFTKGRVYTDNLLLENEQQQWNYEVRFVLKN